MNIQEAISELRELDEPVPKPLRLPNEMDITEAEKVVGMKFPEDYKKFQLGAGNVTYGSLEPATIVGTKDHTDIANVTRNAREMGVPTNVIPICEDNSDFYCLSTDGKVKFWSHDEGDFAEEEWDSLAEWIKEVWIGES